MKTKVTFFSGYCLKKARPRRLFEEWPPGRDTANPFVTGRLLLRFCVAQGRRGEPPRPTTRAADALRWRGCVLAFSSNTGGEHETIGWNGGGICIGSDRTGRAAHGNGRVQTGPYAVERVSGVRHAVKGKRPGVLVVPEWWGLNVYAKHRAEIWPTGLCRVRRRHLRRRLQHDVTPRKRGNIQVRC